MNAAFKRETQRGGHHQHDSDENNCQLVAFTITLKVRG